MKVWVLETGEHYEPSRVVGVYSDRGLAAACVEGIGGRSDRRWIPVDHDADGPIHWEKCSESAWITEHEVDS